ASARPGPHPLACVGARCGAHPRLRLRRLRRTGQRASARPHGPPRGGRTRWRGAGNRVAREGRPRADVGSDRDGLHRRHRPLGFSGVTVEIVTFGCRLNAYESEVMRGHAAALSDTVIVNTCAVTAEAERQARQAIRRAVREQPGARIVVTGCAVQIDPAAWRDLPGVTR